VAKKFKKQKIPNICDLHAEMMALLDASSISEYEELIQHLQGMFRN
jgi:hypothetical protein